MNLSYIINSVTTRPTKKFISYSAGFTSTAHEPFSCEGYNMLTLHLSGFNTARDFKIKIQGRVSNSDAWVNIPVFNSRFVMQPYINIKDAPLYASGCVGNTYFANITGFDEIRTDYEYSGSWSNNVVLNFTLSSSPFSLNKPTQIREVLNVESILTRDTEYIGRWYKSTDGGETDTAQVKPICILGANFCEIELQNNTNKGLLIQSILLYNDFDKSLSNPTFIYNVEKTVEPNNSITVDSWEYPKIIKYQAIALRIGHIDRTFDPTPTGSYNLLINIKNNCYE